jgi:hypothetical protein
VRLVAEEVTHGAEGRGRHHDDDEHRSSEHDESTATTAGAHVGSVLSTGCFVKRTR